jgi:hypothetical protein
MMRARRRRQGLRELRIDVPDPRLGSVRKRVAAQVASLNRGNEDDALEWLEQVSEFDAIDPNKQGNAATWSPSQQRGTMENRGRRSLFRLTRFLKRMLRL